MRNGEPSGSLETACFSDALTVVGDHINGEAKWT
jgi:hypothetical protein